ncbi:MAG: hypothetical protein JO322_11030 [Candidatus Eremiobacteraeota bacterium]|nr:hypothetical protein [Candidatus Eremiobacteraeota bacterium]
MPASEPLMGLREFTRARDDPRVLLLDSRLPGERGACPLTDLRLNVIYASRWSIVDDAIHVAMLVGDRHVVVIDTDEADAAYVAHILRQAGVHAEALERGFCGWQDAQAEVYVS